MSQSLRFKCVWPLRALTVMLSIALVACESVAPKSDAQLQEQWQAQLSWLGGLHNWRVSGRVAVQIPNDGWSASLRWRQSDEQYRIDLSGPFGQGAVRIVGSPTGVELRTSDGQVRHAASPEQLIAEELGTEVPISLLSAWLVGRPASKEPVQDMQLGPDGLLASLSQAGWQIEYSEYEQVDLHRLPSRLAVRRGETEAKFALSSWRLPRITAK